MTTHGPLRVLILGAGSGIAKATARLYAAEGAIVGLAGRNAGRLAEIADDYNSVRSATLQLFRRFDDAAWSRQGLANNNAITVRALAYVIAGHERHHIQILKGRYLH